MLCINLFLATLLLALITVLIGGPVTSIAFLFSLCIAVGFMLLAFYLFLASRFGTVLSLSVGIFFTLLAAIFGGSGLGDLLWPYFPWIWGWTPTIKGQPVPFWFLSIFIGTLAAWVGSRPNKMKNS